MLDEYKNSQIWQENSDVISLRSDILVTHRVVQLLGDVRDKKILDVGCGNGKVSRILAAKGATVIGIDKIQDQIEMARKVPSTITYYEGDMTKLDTLGLSNDFDMSISLMTFLYLDKVEFIEALKQIHRALRNGGRFIYANIHPDRYPHQYKVTDSLPTIDGKTFTTTFYNHDMEFIRNAFIEAGFTIKSELTPFPTHKELQKYPLLFPEKTIHPLYVIIDAEA